MRVIGFDTATDDTVVAAIDDRGTAFERSLPPDDRRPVHSQALLELIDQGVAALGGWERVDRIAVGTGPGTFTGIRIGIATAAGLSASAGLPVVGVPTLEALARSIGEETGAELIMPLIDARRGEVFGALHDGAGQPLEDPFASGPDELIERLGSAAGSGPSPLVAGPGAVRFRDELLRAGLEIEPAGSPVHRLSGRQICELGASAAETGPQTLEPLYLRIPDAQLWLERDGKTDHRNRPSG
jgi:tRNA threonylcarbamoyladenosine biosynthesis protein TsaB